MKVNFGPRYPQQTSTKPHEQSFGYFPLPQCPNDSIMLRYKALLNDLAPTADNMESMRNALKVNKPGTIGPLKEVIIDFWKMKVEDFLPTTTNITK